MSHMSMHRVARLPEQIDKDAFYFLKGEHEHDMDMFVSGTNPDEMLRAITAKDVMARIIQMFSNFMQIIVVIPAEPAALCLKNSIYEHGVAMSSKNYYLAGRKMGGRVIKYTGDPNAGTVMYEVKLPISGTMERSNW